MKPVAALALLLVACTPDIQEPKEAWNTQEPFTCPQRFYEDAPRTSQDGERYHMSDVIVDGCVRYLASWTLTPYTDELEASLTSWTQTPFPQTPLLEQRMTEVCNACSESRYFVFAHSKDVETSKPDELLYLMDFPQTAGFGNHFVGNLLLEHTPTGITYPTPTRYGRSTINPNLAHPFEANNDAYGSTFDAQGHFVYEMLPGQILTMREHAPEQPLARRRLGYLDASSPFWDPSTHRQLLGRFIVPRSTATPEHDASVHTKLPDSLPVGELGGGLIQTLGWSNRSYMFRGSEHEFDPLPLEDVLLGDPFPLMLPQRYYDEIFTPPAP